MLNIIGLVLIMAGWFFQYQQTTKKAPKIAEMFILLYGLGTVLLVINFYNGGMFIEAVLSFISLVVATLVLLKYSK